MKINLLHATIATVAGVALYSTYITGKAVKEVITKDLNPASSENIIYSSISKIGSNASGNANWSLGGWIYDATHSKPVVDKSGDIVYAGGTTGANVGRDNISPMVYTDENDTGWW